MSNYNIEVGKDINWRDPALETITIADLDWSKVIFCNSTDGPIGLIDDVPGFWHGQSMHESWITVLFNLQTGEYNIEDYSPGDDQPDLDPNTYSEVEYTIKYYQLRYGTTWNSLRFQQQLLASREPAYETA